MRFVIESISGLINVCKWPTALPNKAWLLLLLAQDVNVRVNERLKKHSKTGSEGSKEGDKIKISLYSLDGWNAPGLFT